jgi:hypothetical protein
MVKPHNEKKRKKKERLNTREKPTGQKTIFCC